MLGIGIASLSGYVICKIYKLNQKLDEFEEKIERLNMELNMIDEYSDRLYESEKTSPESGDESDEDFKHDHVSRSMLRTVGKRSSLKKCVSFESDLDNLGYETPSTSPERRQQLDDSIDNKFIEQYNIVESLDSLRLISEEKRSLYEKDPDNFNSMIGYLRTLYCLAEKETETETKKSLALEAYNLGKRCIELNPDMYLSHKW